MVEGYCLGKSCRKTREMKNLKEVTMKNGRKANSGNCVSCNTKMFKILGNKKGGATTVSGGKSKRSKRSKRSKKSKVGGKSKKSKKSTKSRKSKRSRKTKA